MNLADIRSDYRRGNLRREDLKPDPIEMFGLWMEEAVKAGVIEPTAMSLATVGADGRPLLRTVLLKGLDAQGFCFFTNLESRKARQIAENAAVSLLFPWLALERQVIITGRAVRLPDEAAFEYFRSRPRDSQIAAWSSPQSSAISGRDVLEQRWLEMQQRFGAGEIPLPPFWGGFVVKPESIEFWQGGPNRLHDRFEYARQSDDRWTISRLAP